MTSPRSIRLMLPMLTVPVAFQILGIFAGSILFMACGKGIGNGDAGSSGTRPAFTSTQIIDATGDGTGNTLSVPYGIAVDMTSGDVYVTGFLSDNAFKITPGGTITEIIDVFGETGNGSCDLADRNNRKPLCESLAVAVDPISGNVMVTGFESWNVFEITPTGGCSTGGIPCTITEVMEQRSVSGPDTLKGPYDLDFDSSSNLYVSSAESNRSFRRSSVETVTVIIDQQGNEAGISLLVPHGIATDSMGNVYITGSGTGGDNVFRIANPGTCSSKGGGTPCTITVIIDGTGDGTGNLFADPHDIAVDSSGNVYVTGSTTNNAFKIEIDMLGTCSTTGTPCTITEIIDASGDGTRPLNFARGIAVDANDNVYVAGSASHNVFWITPGGVITQIINVEGDGTNSLTIPHDLAVDLSGNVYVTGAGTNNVFRIAVP